jgi:hypothetical protein
MSIKSSIKSFTKSSLVNKLLTNVYVLYFVAGLAFLSVIGNLMANNFTTVAFFILVFLLTKHFSNNMIIVLLVPLIFTSLFHIEKSTREGMEDGTSLTPDSTTGNSDTSSTPVSTTTVYSDDTSSTPSSDNSPKPTYNYNFSNPEDEDTPVATTGQGSSNQIQTVKYFDTKEDFQVGDQRQKHTYEIDHAATMKQSYSDLKNSLGPDGIKKLTEDTTSLLKQQAELGQAIKNMEPLIAGMAPLMKTAQGIFGSLGSSSEGGAPSGDLSSLLAMANKLGGSTAASQASSV